jgi:hypothetical protein
LCGALRLVAADQVGPDARLREVKCLMEVVSEVMVYQILLNLHGVETISTLPK